MFLFYRPVIPRINPTRTLLPRCFNTLVPNFPFCLTVALNNALGVVELENGTISPSTVLYLLSGKYWI